MMRTRRVPVLLFVLALVVASGSAVWAQSVGDRVLLIERALGVPGHPTRSPTASRAALRLLSRQSTLAPAGSLSGTTPGPPLGSPGRTSRLSGDRWDEAAGLSLDVVA